MPIKCIFWPNVQYAPDLYASPLKSFSLKVFMDALTVVKFFCCETFYGCVKATYYSKNKPLFQEPIKCKAPGNPENGHSSGEIHTVGAEVTFSCEEGYQLVGVTKITCLESGEWNHLMPHCEGISSECPYLLCLAILDR